uniref:hypothetical protein n=1 Tax=Bacteroides cellulosilyticus TaxID=246787 RepID=UPI004028E9D3
MEFIESDLKFVFDEKQWDVITQFDSETDYKKVKDKLKGTKSIDFLGTTDDNIFFFEMKGFRGYQDQKSVKERLADNAEDLTTEIAQKVRDTLACLLGGARNSTNKSDIWQKCCRIVTESNKRLIVIAWIEEDAPNEAVRKRLKIKNTVRRDKLAQKLSWLTKRIFIMNSGTEENIAGLSVSLMPAVNL